MIKKMICRLAHQWARKMPSSSMYSVEDLIQEGYIVWLNNKDKYDETKKSKETTYLWAAVVWHFNCIKKKEWHRMAISYDGLCSQDDEPYITIDNLIDHSLLSHNNGTERKLMVYQALSQMFELSSDFVFMIVNGVPDDLYVMAKNHQRFKRFRNGWDAIGGRFRVNKSMIKEFFDVDLEKMEQIYYNNV